ncbi:MAG TPA: SIS domain-containing protein [Mycobacteriales bacterium]|nr:SIS domain-containing protein [Mycobacteriales bacterium]
MPVKDVADDLESTINHALAQRAQVGAVMAELASELETVYFVGCGGSLYASAPVGDIMAARGRAVVGSRVEAGEFVYGPPARLGPDSLVVVGSHTGTTLETVKAIEVARDHKARAVLAITRDANSPLATGADHAFTYGSKHTVWEPKQIYLAQIGHAALLAGGDETQSEHDAALDAYSGLGGAILDAIATCDGYFSELATSLANEPVIYVLGAGPAEDVARCLSMCYLQEMQWLHSGAFNANEFFHGAFEVVTDQSEVILFMGQDHSRPIAERARTFLETYARRTWTVDLADLALPGIPEAHRGEVGSLVLGALASRIAQHFEAVTGHDLNTRRYMHKVEY